MFENQCYLGVAGLELYRLTSEENASWFLKRCARQLKYLACEVAYLADYLRAPIQLDKFLAYYRHTVDSKFKIYSIMMTVFRCAYVDFQSHRYNGIRFGNQAFYRVFVKVSFKIAFMYIFKCLVLTVQFVSA
jgi:hypothetical protein